MNYNHILIRFGELSTKGKNRKIFIQKLRDNIKNALADFKNLQIEINYDRMYIILNGHDYQEVADILKDIFGIRSFSLALKVESDIDAIVEGSYWLVQQENKKTFKVKAHRSNKQFPIVSDQINRIVASKILKETEMKVDVRKPELLIDIEVKDGFTYISSSTILGAGGYPVGIQGKILVMLSGGIDSPVASYLTMKRGVQIECIHYASMPYTSERALDKVKELATILSRYQGSVKLHIVPFTNVQLAIYENADESYAITLMRRMMYRIAEKIANKRNCLAISCGDSLGQVASQTLESIYVINDAVKIPVLRPVITMDKIEIMDMAKKIKTYETSILPYEDCCTIFNPKNPVTKPTLKKVEIFESRFEFDHLLDEAVENTEVITLNPNSKKIDEDYF